MTERKWKRIPDCDLPKLTQQMWHLRHPTYTITATLRFSSWTVKVYSYLTERAIGRGLKTPKQAKAFAEHVLDWLEENR